MGPQDFQDYGPMRRRGRAQTSGNMATPQSVPLVELPVRRQGRPNQPLPGNRGRRWAVVLVLLLLIGAGGGTYWGLRYLDQRYSGRIFPNIAVQGVDLTELTPEQATAAVETRFADFLQAPVAFEFGGRIWSPTADELGVQVNVEEQVSAAMRAGRDNGFFRDISQIWTTYQQGLDLPLTIEVDAAKAQSYLAQITGELEQPPVEAQVGIDPTTGALVHNESREGRMALLTPVIDELTQRLVALEPQLVPLQTATLKPALTSGGVAEAKRTVEAMTQAPMELVFKQQDQKFALAQIDIANMIVLTRVNGDHGLLVNAQLDQKQLRKWVTQLADKIGRESVEPRVAWNGGNLQITQPGRTAYRLDIDRALEQLNEMMVGSQRSMELPVDEVQPQATPDTLANLGIKELIAEGKSDFTGSAAYRITNIKAGVNLMNGILVPPSGIFSFNENVGAIDEAHGFTEGYAIVGNRTQKEPGGGICQVSTTLFRAAFYAGVPFDDWTPHRFRISWYEKYDSIGMDSTIFTGGGPDLRFINDTPNWMLIQGSVDEANALVTFGIYGTKVPGREVQRSEALITNETPAPLEAVYIDDPAQPAGRFSQTDVARGGLDIRINRTILQDGVVVNERSFITKFQPWPNIFLKNPSTPVPPGGKLGNG